MSAETAQFDTPPRDAERLAMCEWLRRHGIDPNFVPLHSPITRRLLPDDLPGIEYEAYVHGEDGVILFDKEADDAVYEQRWVPMEANPLPFPDLAPASPPEEQP